MNFAFSAGITLMLVSQTINAEGDSTFARLPNVFHELVQLVFEAAELVRRGSQWLFSFNFRHRLRFVPFPPQAIRCQRHRRLEAMVDFCWLECLAHAIRAIRLRVEK